MHGTALDPGRAHFCPCGGQYGHFHVPGMGDDLWHDEPVCAQFKVLDLIAYLIWVRNPGPLS